MNIFLYLYIMFSKCHFLLVLLLQSFSFHVNKRLVGIEWDGLGGTFEDFSLDWATIVRSQGMILCILEGVNRKKSSWSPTACQQFCPISSKWWDKTILTNLLFNKMKATQIIKIFQQVLHAFHLFFFHQDLVIL